MRWRTRLVLLFAGVSVVSGVGCFDFGSVSNGAPDGGSDATSAADASGTDGGGASDASGGGSGYCALLTPAPTFCDDFDETGAQGEWDQIVQATGCSVSVDTTMPFAGSGSLLAQTPTSVMGDVLEADALKQFMSFQGKAIKISASFEMNVETWDPSSSGQIIAFEIIFKNSPMTFNQIVMNLSSLGSGGVTAQIAENAQGADGGAAGYNSYPFASHPPTGMWTMVEVDLVVASPMSATSNEVSVTVGGVPQLTQQALGVPLQGGSPYAHLGIGYVSAPGGAWKVEYDNFVVDVSTL
jgi:hypothetical protein